jgi:tripartite-type tricarboxylate transporter receptor subunit TctC
MVVKTSQNPDFRKHFETQMTEVVTNSPEEFRKFVEDEIKAMGPVVKSAGLQPF